MARLKYPNVACLLIGGDYKVGDLPPDGYLERGQWAEVQIKGKLRPTQARCGHWLFPQEQESHVCEPDLAG